MRRSRARTRLGVLAAFAAAAVGLPAVAGTFASSDVKTECAEAGVTGHTGTAKLDIGGAWDFAGVVPPDWTAELSYDVAAGTLQSWTASSPVLAVLMKGGDGLVAYAYDGATSSTTAITTPANSSGNPAGISHITFCLGGGEGDPVPDPDPDPLLPLSLGDASAAGTYVETFAWSIDKSTSTPFAVRS
ncbi:MAG TPA: hypothetical protein VM618_13845, partial [Acidimicrobiia bacterium]|nr:hypothetical protein [Acidimicrobiia bacterium]